MTATLRDVPHGMDVAAFEAGEAGNGTAPTGEIAALAQDPVVALGSRITL
jgi:hypothetical protein